MNGTFYGGTSGLLLPIPRRDFPPPHEEKSRLAYYALLQNTIEINSSFYNLPMLRTVSKWAADVPQSFRFTFKLWKEITHQKHLAFDPLNLNRFMEVISGADEKKGALLVQFPPSLQVSALQQLEKLLALLAEWHWPVAAEFRHRSWYCDDVYHLLKNFNAAMVIQDMPASSTPLETTSEDLVYVRFHGPDGNYKGSYSDGFLYEYSLYILEWQREGKTVYVYFNNTAGDALNNLNFLKRCLD